MAEPDRPAFLDALQDPTLYDHPLDTFELVETHISWVLLTGRFAYKIKKPVNLGFVDFSTLDKRRFYCQEEIRLNRRLAPDLYLAVVSITGASSAPRLDGDGPVIEYAVKMRQFPRDAKLDLVLKRGALERRHLDGLTREIAAFHQRVDVASVQSEYSTPEVVRKVVIDTFGPIPERLERPSDRECLDTIRAWVEREFEARYQIFQDRRRDGFIRECHGDLHLGNMALIDDLVVVFDCIEFNEQFRWIDVMSEAAFLVMDLEDQQRFDLAGRFLNGYLERTGDYAGLRLLRYYLTYRAMVRATVAAIRLGQKKGDSGSRLREELQGYLSLAKRSTRPGSPMLMITHGLSASGKSVIAERLVEQLHQAHQVHAIRIRSDVERKRLFGLSPEARSNAVQDIYRPDATEATYRRLEELARMILRTGYPVIVDATFLKQRHRRMFQSLAEEVEVPFVILSLQVSDSTLRGRIIDRAQASHEVSEADLAVLDKQRTSAEPLTADEQPSVLSIDAERTWSGEMLEQMVREKLKGSWIRRAE